jgi:hypothetical protein
VKRGSGGKKRKNNVRKRRKRRSGEELEWILVKGHRKRI